MEVWKTIKGFKDYEVSNLGNVKSLSNEFTRKERLLKKGTIKNGYNIVVLINDKNKKTKSTISGIQSGKLWKHIN